MNALGDGLLRSVKRVFALLYFACKPKLAQAFGALLLFYIASGPWLFKCVAAETTSGGEGSAYRFSIGSSGDKTPTAFVAVEQVLPPEKKRTVIKLSKDAVPIVRGIAVRFEQIEPAALDELPQAIQSLAKTPRFQMQRLALYAPGDPVPRLMAEEVVVRAPGDWILKGVLLADRPSETTCRLLWNKGEAKLAFAKGKTLGFGDLLANRESR